jgi:hypothetical protein
MLQLLPLCKYKPFITSNDGDKDNKDGGNDNNHRKSIDTGSNRGSNRIQGNHMVQDKVVLLGGASTCAY